MAWEDLLQQQFTGVNPYQLKKDQIATDQQQFTYNELLRKRQEEEQARQLATDIATSQASTQKYLSPIEKAQAAGQTPQAQAQQVLASTTQQKPIASPVYSRQLSDAEIDAQASQQSQQAQAYEQPESPVAPVVNQQPSAPVEQPKAFDKVGRRRELIQALNNDPTKRYLVPAALKQFAIDDVNEKLQQAKQIRGMLDYIEQHPEGSAEREWAYREVLASLPEEDRQGLPEVWDDSFGKRVRRDALSAEDQAKAELERYKAIEDRTTEIEKIRTRVEEENKYVDKESKSEVLRLQAAKKYLQEMGVPTTDERYGQIDRAIEAEIQGKSKPAASVNVNMAGEKRYNEKEADLLAQRNDEARTIREKSSIALASLNELEATIRDPKTPQGVAVSAMSAIGKYASALGINTKGMDNARIVEQVTKQLELEMSSLLKGQGQISDAERALINSASIRATDTKEQILKAIWNRKRAHTIAISRANYRGELVAKGLSYAEIEKRMEAFNARVASILTSGGSISELNELNKSPSANPKGKYATLAPISKAEFDKASPEHQNDWTKNGGRVR